MTEKKERATFWGQNGFNYTGVREEPVTQREDVIGRGFTFLKKREVVTALLILYALIPKCQILDHSSPWFHFIWTIFMELEFLPCITVLYDSSDAFLKDKAWCCSLKTLQYLEECLNIITGRTRGRNKKKWCFKIYINANIYMCF